MLAVGLRCRAMLQAAHGDLRTATATAELAMAQHRRLPMPFERARTQTAGGPIATPTTPARRRHRHLARSTKNVPTTRHHTLGRTRLAPKSPGNPGARRRAERPTPSEQRVAELAVSGLTNRDIAATLFISPKTVEVNLSRIYRKLNIRSRVELYKALGTPKK